MFDPCGARFHCSWLKYALFGETISTSLFAQLPTVFHILSRDQKVVVWEGFELGSVWNDSQGTAENALRAGARSEP